MKILDWLESQTVAECKIAADEIKLLRQQLVESKLMSECTVMLHNDLVQAGIVKEGTAPMFLTESIFAFVQNKLANQKTQMAQLVEDANKLLNDMSFDDEEGLFEHAEQVINLRASIAAYKASIT